MSTQSAYGQPTYTRHGVDNEAREALNAIHDELTRVAADLSAEQVERTRQVNQVRFALASTERDTAELARTTRRLTARVGWLEDRLRASGTIPVADLEAISPESKDLAETVLAGRDAEESLLDPAELATLATTVDSFARLGEERDQAAEDVLNISADLESSSRTDPTHAHQLARFGAAEQRLAFATKAVADNLRFARSAQARLALDTESRAELTPTITVGQEAQEALEAELRTRLTDEVARGALLPPWFSTDLGPEPLDEASATTWLTTAANALTHRLVYTVTHPQSLLGPPPTPADPKHRVTDHARLTADLNDLDT